MKQLLHLFGVLLLPAILLAANGDPAGPVFDFVRLNVLVAVIVMAALLIYFFQKIKYIPQATTFLRPKPSPTPEDRILVEVIMTSLQA